MPRSRTPKTPHAATSKAPAALAAEIPIIRRESGYPSDPHMEERTSLLMLEALLGISSPKEFFDLLGSNNADTQKLTELFNYERDLEKLQIELVKMQRWIQEKRRRVAILFEGRDAA